MEDGRGRVDTRVLVVVVLRVVVLEVAFVLVVGREICPGVVVVVGLGDGEGGAMEVGFGDGGYESEATEWVRGGAVGGFLWELEVVDLVEVLRPEGEEATASFEFTLPGELRGDFATLPATSVAAGCGGDLGIEGDGGGFAGPRLELPEAAGLELRDGHAGGRGARGGVRWGGEGGAERGEGKEKIMSRNWGYGG